MIRLNGYEIQTERFPNNETRVKDFEQHIFLDGMRENVLEFKYFNDENLVLLMFVKKRIDEFNVPCTLFIWYMSYSRMDRKIEGDLFNLKYICDYLNWLNFAKVIVMEPHSDKTMQLLKRATAIYPVKDWVKPEELGENVQIVFPDKGAVARYSECNYPNVCIMEKIRNPYTGWITDIHLKEGTIIPGSKCIVIDDLCATGTTMYKTANILKEAGASEIVLVVSHCETKVFDGELLKDNSPISRIYTSKSIMCVEHPKIHYMDINVLEYVNQCKLIDICFD